MRAAPQTTRRPATTRRRPITSTEIPRTSAGHATANSDYVALRSATTETLPWSNGLEQERVGERQRQTGRCEGGGIDAIAAAPATTRSPASGSVPRWSPIRTATAIAPKSAPESAPNATAVTYYAPAVRGPRTLTEQIISTHAVERSDEEIAVAVDQVLL